MKQSLITIVALLLTLSINTYAEVPHNRFMTLLDCSITKVGNNQVKVKLLETLAGGQRYQLEILSAPAVANADIKREFFAVKKTNDNTYSNKDMTFEQVSGPIGLEPASLYMLTMGQQQLNMYCK